MQLGKIILNWLRAAKMDKMHKIGTGNGGRPVFRQHHQNTDGRDVFLYGYEEKKRTPVGEPLTRDTQSSELRWHPLRQEWNAYAAARQNRTYKPGAASDPLAPMTPSGPPTEIPFSDFELAIFENRFPTLSSAAFAGANEFVDVAPARGRCEVVVYGPEPEGSLATIGQDRRHILLNAWIDRYNDLFADGIDFVLPFENRGEEVGVTLHHPHGQIYGFQDTPNVQARAAKAFQEGFDLCAQLNTWRDDYWVTHAGGIVAYCPPFARFPYEVWLSPLTPRPGPWAFSAEEADGFCSLLGTITEKYDALFGRPTPYMMSLHAAPQSAGDDFQFTTQFYPILRAPERVKFLASVEQATGVFTVDILPERAARALSDA